MSDSDLKALAFAAKVLQRYDAIYEAHDGNTLKRTFKEDCARELARLADEAERVVWEPVTTND